MVVVLVVVTWFEMGKQEFRMAAQVVQVFVTDNILWRSYRRDFLLRKNLLIFPCVCLVTNCVGLFVFSARDNIICIACGQTHDFAHRIDFNGTMTPYLFLQHLILALKNA